ncbi:MAG: 3-deoxy-manno-octulosonate cytidylyltransferase [Boseongicola sp.]|nr:3-deoxy-manno-octulosonate cytidylyltransferase [Boseongicola sp.]MDD9977569.1 3-deoxy-manno-octulosonate cytidylyltransferase [Boseongicola sp.]
MDTVIIIPARYQSSRFPGKPLQGLKGATGVTKSLVERSWDAAVEVGGVDEVFVATDDDRIANAVAEFGGQIVMTSSECRNGTERCADAISKLGVSPEIVVNLQGDAPLTPPHYVETLIKSLSGSPDVKMATPVLRTEAEHVEALRADRKAGRVGATTAVFDRNMNALYFSKEVLPFYDNAPADAVSVFHHVGCYAYRSDALEQYVSLPEGPLEKREGLEQLRFLENGIPIRCVEVEARGRAFWELNNPSDVALIEEIMTREGIA